MKVAILLTLGLAFSLPLRAEEGKAPSAPTGLRVLRAEEERASAKEMASPGTTFKKKDKNSDGFLSQEEFVGKAANAAKTKAEEAFKKKDKDSDIKLSLAEFSAKAGKGGGKKKK